MERYSIAINIISSVCGLYIGMAGIREMRADNWRTGIFYFVSSFGWFGLAAFYK